MYIYTTQQIPIIYTTQQLGQTTTCTGGNYCCSDYLLCNLIGLQSFSRVVANSHTKLGLRPSIKDWRLVQAELKDRQRAFVKQWNFLTTARLAKTQLWSTTSASWWICSTRISSASTGERFLYLASIACVSMTLPHAREDTASPD